jgi:hypothetical protein
VKPVEQVLGLRVQVQLEVRTVSLPSERNVSC